MAIDLLAQQTSFWPVEKFKGFQFLCFKECNVLYNGKLKLGLCRKISGRVVLFNHRNEETDSYHFFV